MRTSINIYDKRLRGTSVMDQQPIKGEKLIYCWSLHVMITRIGFSMMGPLTCNLMLSLSVVITILASVFLSIFLVTR